MKRIFNIRRKRLTLEDVIMDLSITLVFIATLVVCIYPFYYVLIMSFNDGIDMMKGGVYFWPRVFTLSNYEAFFTDPSWLNATLVTIARTLIGTVMTILLTTLVAYGLSFKELLLRKTYMFLLILSMYFSGGLIPYYMVVKWLGLMNSFLVYVIPGMLNLFFVLVAISFFQEIPKELRESAMLDGANDLLIFSRIILPISLPLLATIAIFTGVGQWNSWFDSAFFIRNENLRTLGYKLMQIIAANQLSDHASTAEMGERLNTTTTLSIQVTAMIIATGPIILIYPFLQRYFIKGIMIGSVKG